MEDEERLKKLEAGKAKVGGGCGATGAGRLGEARSARLRGAAGLRRDWAAGPAANKAAEDALCAALPARTLPPPRARLALARRDHRYRGGAGRWQPAAGRGRGLTETPSRLPLKPRQLPVNL